MPFTLVWPEGVNQALLGVFLLIGLLGVGISIAARQLPLALSTAVHCLAASFSLLAGDLITFLATWELLTFSAFIIIRLGRTTAGKASAPAAYWYLGAQISAAALFFVAIVFHFNETGSLAVGRLVQSAQPFMLVAVLIKTAMMPLHGWLVGSYTKAGFFGSFVLSAYATKVGVYTAARTVAFSIATVPVLSMIGAVVALVSVFFALAQHSARRLLSYHIVSQVGYMLAGVGLAGAGLAGAELAGSGLTDAGLAGAGLAGVGLAGAGITAGLFHAVNNIIYKGLFFLVVAVVAARLGHDDLRRMGGLARTMPLVFICGVIGALSISGLPFTNGYASKELLKKAGGELQIVLITLASIGTGLSFTKFIYLIFLRPAHRDGPKPDAPPEAVGAVATRRAVSPAASVALVVLASLSIAVGLAPGIVPGVPAHAFYSRSAILAGVWPAAVALALWGLLRRRLVSVGRADDPDPVIRRALKIASRPLLAWLRRTHRMDPQFAIVISVAGAVVLTVALVVL